jgi:hypothetical protein
MKTKKKYYPSQSCNGIKKIIKSKNKKEDIILVHRIAISGLSRAMAEEQISKYIQHMPKSHGNLNILNIFLPMGESCSDPTTDVKMIYPNYAMLKDETFSELSNIQKRKMKIFELIHELNETK